MFEFPDRRFLYLSGALLLALLVGALVDPPPSSIAWRPVLLLAFISFGWAWAYLDLKVGYSIQRPSITREDSPTLFWLDVLTGLLVPPLATLYLFARDFFFC